MRITTVGPRMCGVAEDRWHGALAKVGGSHTQWYQLSSQLFRTPRQEDQLFQASLGNLA